MVPPAWLGWNLTAFHYCMFLYPAPRLTSATPQVFPLRFPWILQKSQRCHAITGTGNAIVPNAAGIDATAIFERTSDRRVIIGGAGTIERL